jgi:Xaa-Pro aminopeptidase
MNEINDRLALLRAAMTQQGIDATIVPSADAHQSEYVSDHWMVRAWISGFTGSAGTAVITQDHAGVFTDGRYFLQAETELANSDFVLQKYISREAHEEVTYLADTLPAGSTVAVDGRAFATSTLRAYEVIFKKKDITLSVDADLFSSVWTDRPPLLHKSIYEHDVTYAGIDRKEKIAQVRQAMEDAGANHHLITTLDDIGWLLNLRGSDVTFNPVFMSYVLVTPSTVQLYCDTSQVQGQLAPQLDRDGVVLAPYDQIESDLLALPKGAVIMMDPTTVNGRLSGLIACQTVERDMPTRMLKAIKNPTEQKHIRECMIQDGIALAKTFYWLEQALEIRTVSEVELSDKLAEMRSQQPHYVSESFDAIVGYKGNGAIIHYKPEASTCADIKAEGMLLVDSGGQYVNGTTDITRTFCLSEPTDQQRLHYTLVLKGMISLTKATFPVGSTGQQLDTFARMHLWDEGLNFAHGTGHGVGFFMNVHEPPQGFAPAGQRAKTRHRVGMYTSNEPGFYLEGHYGIRIENLMITQASAHDGFLEHETVTLYPLALDLIDETIMTTREKAWLNKYQHKCYSLIAPHLSKAEQEWFTQKCKPLN